MEERIARFIAALRASGVRVSIAESQDAWQAIEHLGITDREAFRLSLRSTLIKDAGHIETFEYFFPLYFGTGAPPLIDPQAELSPEQQQMLQDAMQDLLEQAKGDLEQLLEWLLSGRGPTQEQLEELANRAGMDDPSLTSPYMARRYARRMQQLLDWNLVQDLLEQLWEQLAEQGWDPADIEELQLRVEQNLENLQEQLAAYAGQRLRDSAVEEYQKRDSVHDLMDRSFGSLSSHEMEALREQVRRLTARLRTRVALRQKRGKQGKLDAKSTIRANLRYGGVPFEMKFKQRRLKPKLLVFVDISTSMRPLAEFFLRLLYELQDQVKKTRSYVFNDHLEDVTPELLSMRADSAVQAILYKIPPGYYATDFGYSLRQFEAEFMGAVDHRTTVIVVGDGRNNYNDPELSIVDTIVRRARKLIWLNPEYPAQWGTGDSDMLLYAPICTEVHQVRNLRQLTEAVDRMLG